MPENLGISIHDGLARVTLTRPPLNVLTIAMMRELAETIEGIGRDPDARVVLLDAEGKAFCAGVDVGEHMGEMLPEMLLALDELFGAMDRAPLPIVAAVQGAALGGGCELVLGADLCLASERAKFGLPEIRLGVFAPPASILLPRLVGERRALELLLTGGAVPSAEALRIGLVNAVFPEDGFTAEVDRWVARLTGLSGSALRYAKQAVKSGRDGTFQAAHQRLSRLYADELMSTDDATEGLQSFLEKRPPAWVHR